MVYARIDEPHAELVQLPGTRLTKQPLLQLAGGFLGSAEAKATLQSCCMHAMYERRSRFTAKPSWRSAIVGDW